MTTHDDAGPATRWLAERAGVPPHELVANPGLLARALAEAAQDPDAAAELRSRLSEEPTPAQRFEATVARALRGQAERLRRPPD
ncbi:hypothetical protein D0Z08_30230 [Nocardioides immobilis]|uniref:Uncharacterized protein n=1 Tax=Nocardioides immobilis TaxID=2049295 RepID=A0A417XSS1_9ACTN|nr:hypothetical protein [Nocardioides immobilis]RHW23370.1 hypothetical protein D0Z08_30230 [Nocardioides immobilis]